MRKIIGLLVAVVLVMSLATVAFATTDAGSHDIADIAELPASITLDAGETATYMISDYSCFGNTLEVVGVNGQVMVNMWTTANTADSADNKAAVVLDGRRSCQVDITNVGSETAEYALAVVVPAGTMNNPVALELVDGAAQVELTLDFTLMQNEYYYSYTAAEACVLNITNIAAVDPTDAANAIDDYNIMMSVDGFYNYTESMNEDWTPGSQVSYTLAAGETVLVYVRATDYDMGPAAIVTFDVALEPVAGTYENPIFVDAIGDYVVEGDEVWYAVNSMLAGNIIVVQGEDAAIEIEGTVIPAVDGIATAVLNGEGATIAVKVTNADDMIILPAPLEIEALGDYTVDVAAGAEVEIAVNSMLAGATLTVEGEGAYIYMNGTHYPSVDGVVTVILEGEGATIAVKIGNASEAAAQYALNIAYGAPYEVDAAGDYEATIPAGQYIELAVNSMLAGATITVEGEGAYLIVDGTTYKAVDGVVSAVLNSEGATIAVVIGNESEEDAVYPVTIAFAPTAINAESDFKVTVAAGAAVEYVVNSKLDGAVVTVKGEGAYLIVDGVKVEGKDGVVTATLEAKGATISLVIGNAGTAAAEYEVSVDVPAGNPETGDFGIIAAVVALATSAVAGTAVIAKKKEN